MGSQREKSDTDKRGGNQVSNRNERLTGRHAEHQTVRSVDRPTEHQTDRHTERKLSRRRGEISVPSDDRVRHDSRDRSPLSRSRTRNRLSSKLGSVIQKKNRYETAASGNSSADEEQYNPSRPQVSNS